MEGGSKETAQTRRVCLLPTLMRTGACWHERDLCFWEGARRRSLGHEKKKKKLTSLPPSSSSSGATRQAEAGMQERGNNNRECPSPWSYLAGLDYKLKTHNCMNPITHTQNSVVNPPLVSPLPIPGGRNVRITWLQGFKLKNLQIKPVNP